MWKHLHNLWLHHVCFHSKKIIEVHKCFVKEMGSLKDIFIIQVNENGPQLKTTQKTGR